MLPHRVSNPGPLFYESGALPIALRGPASMLIQYHNVVLTLMQCQFTVVFPFGSSLIDESLTLVCCYTHAGL